MNTQAVNNVTYLSLSGIKPSIFNPRKHFSEEQMQELTTSIQANGVLQPILVRPQGETYQIVYGERRFKASIIAGLTTIPATIWELTDEQAMEISLIENLTRANLTAMEEAIYYKQLLTNSRYDIAALTTRFGKSEHYIRTRLKINDLIPELTDLLDKDILNISTAFELSKYNTEIQAELYGRNFKDENAYNGWRGLTAKEIATRIERSYTTRLDDYLFDKTVCYSCPNNSANQCLFSMGEECGNCCNRECLKQKNTAYLVSRVEELVSHNIGLSICQPRYGGNAEATSELKEKGHEVLTPENTTRYPIAPEEPQAQDYETAEIYEQERNSYYEKFSAYNDAIAEINERYQQRTIMMYACIEDKTISLRYAEVTENVSDDTAPIEKLKQKDERKKEISVEKTVAETKKLVEEADLTHHEFTFYEDKLLYYMMLSDLKTEHYTLLGITEKRYFLSDEDRLSVLNNLTEEMKTIIRRDFIIKGFCGTFGVSTQSTLFMDFARQHLPEKVVEIENRHEETYVKFHERSQEKREQLEKQEQNKRQEQVA